MPRERTQNMSAQEQTDRLKRELDRAYKAIEEARATTEQIAEELRFPLASSTRLREAREDAEPETD